MLKNRWERRSTMFPGAVAIAGAMLELVTARAGTSGSTDPD